MLLFDNSAYTNYMSPEGSSTSSITMVPPAPPARLLWRFDHETAKKLADIKQMEAALQRKEIAEAEAKRLAEKRESVKSARIADRTCCVINLNNDLELLLNDLDLVSIF